MRILIALADGVEEMEAVITIDVLRRAALEVVAAAIGERREVKASRGVRLVADALWSELQPESFDLLALPGGMGGVRALAADSRVLAALRAFLAAGKPVAAICAAPLVLQAAGLLKGRAFTCHPGAAAEIRPSGIPRQEAVVEDGPLITSQGPGTAIAFALAIVRRLAGDAAAEKVAKELG
jgi:DJ-1 family protein